MGQMGFFDVSKRYAGLDAKADPLVKLNAMVPWDAFRPRLEALWRRPAESQRSKAGRKPWDAVVMFKAIVLCNSTTSRTNSSSTSSATGCRSCASWGWVWRMRSRTRRRSVSTASSWFRPGSSMSCSTPP